MEQYLRDYEFQPIKTYELYPENIDEHFIKTNKGSFNLFHTNIRSVGKNFDELKLYLEQFETEFQCIILTETFKIIDESFFNIEGYNLLYNNGNINKNDGTILYIKNSINYSSHIVDIDIIKAIQIKFKYGNKNIFITAVYRPPSTCEKSFLNKLQCYLRSIEQEEADYNIIAGDININIKVDGDITEEYLNIMSEHNFCSTINTFTREEGEARSCIDHIFLKNIPDMTEILPVVVKSKITDHYPVLIKLPVDNEQEINQVSNNSFKIIDNSKLKNEIKNVNWYSFYNAENINTATNILVSNISNVINKCTNNIKLPHKKRKRTPWITSGLLVSIKKRDALYKKLEQNTNNMILKEQFITYRNNVKKLIEITKNNYYKTEIEKNKKNSKHLWNIVNDISNCKKKENIIKEIKTKTDNVISDLSIANEFIQFFTNVGKTLANKIKKPADPTPRQSTSFSCYLLPTNRTEIEQTIHKLKNNKAPGIDLIKAETLKIIASDISEHLTFLFNNIFDSGICPSAFKIAVIKPLFKCGDKTDVANYRPISIITNLTKVFEKILKSRMNNYIKKHNLISERQFGFQENKCTEDAISYLISNIYKSVDESKPCLCVFLDLAKAFDTVCHSQLLETLEDNGFRGPVLKLLKSYISERKQVVKINSAVSEELTVQYGVPQGTVLGPLLFIIYINNILNQNSKGTIISFADDTAILYVAETWRDLKILAEEDMKNIKKCFDQKVLTINYTKTKYLPFGCYKNSLPSFSSIDIGMGITIMEAESVKYLGVVIDRNLRWNIHITNVCNTLRSILFRFRYLKRVLDAPTLKTIYYALVESRLRYGIIAWGSSLKEHIKKLEVIQKIFIKIIFNKPTTYPSDKLYSEARILDLQQLFFLVVSIYQFNNKATLLEINHNYNTRQKLTKYKTPFCFKSIGQRSCLYLAPRFYNQLPNKIKEIRNLKKFKIEIKKYIFDIDRLTLQKLIEMKT